MSKPYPHNYTVTFPFKTSLLPSYNYLNSFHNVLRCHNFIVIDHKHATMVCIFLYTITVPLKRSLLPSFSYLNSFSQCV